MTSVNVARDSKAASREKDAAAAPEALSVPAIPAAPPTQMPDVVPSVAKRSADDRSLMRRLILIRRIVPFAMVHLAALGVFFVPFAWVHVLLLTVMYTFLVLGIAAWMHRYFSHRSFKTSRAFQFVLAFWAGCSAQRGTLWWAAHHRRHHAFSDTEDDPHSPTLRQFWQSHVSWIWEDEHQGAKTKWVRDLSRYPELRFFDRYYWVPPLVLWVAVAGLGAWWGSSRAIGAWGGALSFFLWGPMLATVLSWHAIFCVNSVTHLWGWKRYSTEDHSLNNTWVALFAFGEGWHNNHHYYQHSANIGFHWWEIDVSYYTIVLFEKLGLIWDVHRAPRKAITGRYRSAPPRRERAGRVSP